MSGLTKNGGKDLRKGCPTDSCSHLLFQRRSESSPAERRILTAEASLVSPGNSGLTPEYGDETYKY